MRRIAGIAAVIAALGGAACSDDVEEDTGQVEGEGLPAPAASPDTTGAAAALVAIDVTLREWTVELSQDTVAAGPVTFRVRNAGTAAHAFEVEGMGEEWNAGEIAPGSSVTMSVELGAGEYKVYCPLAPGAGSHESQGMVTRLRVQ